MSRTYALIQADMMKRVGSVQRQYRNTDTAIEDSEADIRTLWRNMRRSRRNPLLRNKIDYTTGV